MQIAKEEFFSYISSYEEDELFYRELYLQEKKHPETFSEYLKHIDQEFVISHQIFVPALLDAPWYPYMNEQMFFSDRPVHIMMAKHYRYTPEFIHQHEFFEILCVYEGQAPTTIQGKTCILKKGDVCIIPPNTKHSVGIFDDSVAINLMIRASSFDATFFQLLAQDSPFARFFSHVLYNHTEGNYLIFHSGESPVIRSCLEDLYIEFLGHKKYCNTFLNTLMMLFWAQLLRYHEQDMNCYLTKKNGSISIPAVIHYLSAHYQDITLSKAADHFGFSPAYFTTLLKEATGQSFLQIIKTIKIEQACRALRETNLSIHDICQVVGYDNPEHFIRIFKKEKGITPGAYRKSFPA